MDSGKMISKEVYSSRRTIDGIEYVTVEEALKVLQTFLDANNTLDKARAALAEASEAIVGVASTSRALKENLGNFKEIHKNG